MNSKFDRRIIHRTMIEPDHAALQPPAHAASQSRLFASISSVEYYISTRISPKQGSDDKLPTQSRETTLPVTVPK